MHPAARRRPPRVAQLIDWAWARYDDLSDPQRVLLGVLVVLVLAASALYLLGAASLLAIQRLPETTPAATAIPEQAAARPTSEVDPISPLLADITPTPRPTFTPRPTSTASPTPRPSPTFPRAGAPGGIAPRSTPAPTRPPGVAVPSPSLRSGATTRLATPTPISRLR